MQHKLIRFIFFMLVAGAGVLLMPACQNENCISIFNNDLLVDFLYADTLEDGSVKFSDIDTVFYTVKALGNDTVYYDSTDVTSHFVLPVNPAADQTTFQFEVIDSIRYDTLSLDPVVIDTTYYLNKTPHLLNVSYHRGHRIITEDCGVEITYTQVQVDESTFPAYLLIDDKLSRLNEVNIEILY